MKNRSPFYRAMKAMQALGELDFKSGKPITAFPDREGRAKIAGKQAAMFPDRARAAYEMGWRIAKDENITNIRN